MNRFFGPDGSWTNAHFLLWRVKCSLYKITLYLRYRHVEIMGDGMKMFAASSKRSRIKHNVYVFTHICNVCMERARECASVRTGDGMNAVKN